ncbi:MAG: oxidoreductase family protein [Winogradskyella sp.]
MNNKFQTFILEKTNATSLQEVEIIQELWSGYGHIKRFALEGSPLKSVVVKNVQYPNQQKHLRRWNSELSHERKLKSYQVETAWYTMYAEHSKARLPKCYGISKQNNEVCIVLEDLDAVGYTHRKQDISWQGIDNCLAWLANFHATYLGQTPLNLWAIGSYWHLATRPDEFAVLSDAPLKKAASYIDKKLNNCTYTTFIHGDAKLANFCFSASDKVAGVDFQYVGGGCGIKDVAYFMGSCLQEEECKRLEADILTTYFTHLHSALGAEHKALEKEWRILYPYAWADFHRFLKGWSPSHWKLNSYSERITQKVIKELSDGL